MMEPDGRVRLNRRKVLHLLDQLANNLGQRNVQAELFVVGGGAIILAYDSERLTYDVDALFEPKSIVYEEAHRIAEENHVQSDWLNDAVKVHLIGDDPHAAVAYRNKWLKVAVGTPKYLLAMKLVASRPEDDIDDIRLLLEHCGYPPAVTAEEIFDDLQRNWPVTGKLFPPKSYYILQDILAEQQRP
ncbi:MAG: DUF6036 family nucleotidyltransferase [Acidimicrobiales bacterium]